MEANIRLVTDKTKKSRHVKMNLCDKCKTKWREGPKNEGKRERSKERKFDSKSRTDDFGVWKPETITSYHKLFIRKLILQSTV
jgi:hypothetical protein